MQRRNFLKLIGVSTIIPHLPVETAISQVIHIRMYGKVVMPPGSYDAIILGTKVHNAIERGQLMIDFKTI
jgi:hypothetical protein